ncbi:MAG: MFS transporter [bacterium]
MFKHGNEKKKKIHPNIYLLGIASLLNDLSSEMITPILPLLIAKFGGAGIAIGLIGGIREGFASILHFLFGYLSDKATNRKNFIYAGYFTSTLFKIMLIFAHTWQQILLFTGLERIGKSIRTAPKDALISRSAPERIGLGFGINRALDNAGALLGSVVVFFMLWRYHFDITVIILIAGIIAIFSIPPLIWVKEENNSHQPDFKFRLSDLSSSFKIFLIIASIFSCANLSYMFFMIKAQQTLPGASDTIPIFLYILFNTSYTFVAIPLGNLSDRIGRLISTIIGYALFSLTTLGFVYAQSLTMFIILFITYGIALAFIKINHKAFASDLSPKTLQATAQGTFETVTGIATLIAGIVIGFLWEYINPQTALVYTSILGSFATLLLVGFKKHLTL